MCFGSDGNVVPRSSDHRLERAVRRGWLRAAGAGRQRPHVAACADGNVERQVESPAPNIPWTPKCDPSLQIWLSSRRPRGAIVLQTSRERVVRREC
jgi:hypothetical protein